MCKWFILQVLLGETNGSRKQERKGKKPGRGVILGERPQPDPAKELWSVNDVSESVLTGEAREQGFHVHTNHLQAKSHWVGREVPSLPKTLPVGTKRFHNLKTFYCATCERDKGTLRESGGISVICSNIWIANLYNMTITHLRGNCRVLWQQRGQGLVELYRRGKAL